ncbi:MAG TPA: hypothetical protein VG759_23750 [Candidatus Angelobacter sp.]|jgi:hypothetical protein|nr:hypothetical protein [Candidatus Angelobacter sp.]
MLRALSIPLGLMLALLGTAAAQTQIQPAPPAQDLTQNTPAQQLPPSQMPPSSPRISYAGGFLTVVASNATLDEVLVGIGKAIGANIQGIQAQAPERVFGQFGPASPCQVLDSLLVGSRYDFILVGSPGRVGAVREIILSPSSTQTNQSAQLAIQPSIQGPIENNPPAVVNNQQPPTDLSPEERAGFRRNRRGPGAREIVRPQSPQPDASATPPSPSSPNP